MANHRIPSSQLPGSSHRSSGAAAGDMAFKETKTQVQDRAQLCVSAQDNKLELDFASSFDNVDLAIEEILSFIKQLDTNLSFFEVNLVLRDCCKIPHASRFSNNRIMLIWIMAALLTVNRS